MASDEDATSSGRDGHRMDGGTWFLIQVFAVALAAALVLWAIHPPVPTLSQQPLEDEGEPCTCEIVNRTTETGTIQLDELPEAGNTSDESDAVEITFVVCDYTSE